MTTTPHTALDQSAFTASVQRHRRELHVHCYRMLGSFEESEDAVQETFLRAWRRRETLKEHSAVRAWLYKIATNACLDALDKRPRRPTASGEGALLIEEHAPNPAAVRVTAYERDFGDPEETAKRIQEEVAKLSEQVASLAAPASAADGPGIGAGAVAAGAGAIAAGPLGALLATGIVSTLGLGDDFIDQSLATLFGRPEVVGTPAPMGVFENNEYNVQLTLDGQGRGRYEVFFDVHVKDSAPPVTVPPPNSDAPPVTMP
jgi:RNA polymerase sigma factor (sigma-70 family)